jgi:hypothetical protein
MVKMSLAMDIPVFNETAHGAEIASQSLVISRSIHRFLRSMYKSIRGG